MAEDAQTLVALAATLKQKGDIAGAVQALRRAHTAAPQNAVILEKLGTMLLKEDNLAEAEQVYGAALVLAPQSINVLHNLALVLERTGRTDEALQSYYAILAFAPDYGGALNNAVRILATTGRFTRGHVTVMRRGKRLRAVDALGFAQENPQLCLAHDPTPPVARFLLSVPDAEIVSPGLIFQGETFVDAFNGYTAFESAVHSRGTFPFKIAGGAEGLSLTLEEPPRQVSVTGRVGLFSATGNYASWMFGELPKLAAYLDAGIVDFIFHGAAQPFYFDTLAAFGIGRDRLRLIAADAAVIVPNLVLATPTYDHHTMAFPALESLRARFFAARPELAAPQSTRSLYISRARLGPVHDRRIANEAEIETLLAAQGFEVIHPQECTFAEQAALFASARRIIAPFGAALANCIFCAPGTQVGVIETKASPEFGRLFAWRDIDSYVLRPEGRQVRAGNSISQSHEFNVDPGVLRAMVAAMAAKN